MQAKSSPTYSESKIKSRVFDSSNTNLEKKNILMVPGTDMDQSVELLNFNNFKFFPHCSFSFYHKSLLTIIILFFFFLNIVHVGYFFLSDISIFFSFFFFLYIY